MRRTTWPLPVAVVAPAGAIVVVVVAMTWPMLDWPYPLWVQTSAQFHQQFTWAGLIAGTGACWYATLFHSRDRIWRQPGAPRLGAPVVTRQLAVLTGWFGGAYLFALLPLVVATIVNGGVGTPDPLAIASGVLAMVAAIALGYALGTVVPSPIVVPITAAGFYALLVLGNAGGERFAAVAPVLYFEPYLGQRESLPLLVFRIAVFVVIATVAAGLAATTVRRLATGTPRPWRTLTDVAAYLVLPVALIAVSLIRQPVVFSAEPPNVPICTEQRGIRYCVHPANQPRLADLIATVDPVIARFGTKPGNLDQVWDQALTHRTFDEDIEVAWLEPDGTVSAYAEITISGLYACPVPHDRRSEEQAQLAGQVAGDLLDFLTTGAPPAGTFAGMSAADVQGWVADHQTRLHSCTLTPSQLPAPA